MKNSLKSVCLRNNINFSSAKNVLQIYRREGRMEKKMFRERRNPNNNNNNGFKNKKNAADTSSSAACSDHEGESILKTGADFKK